MDPDHLVQGLTVAPPLYGFHQEVFRGGKGQVFPHGPADHSLVHHQAGSHVVIEAQDGVRGQEGLGQGKPPVGGIVQGAFKPLGGGGHGAVEGVRHDEAGQAADPLGTHGVPLIGHGGGTHLMVGKGLLDLALVLQEADIPGKAVGALGDGG